MRPHNLFFKTPVPAGLVEPGLVVEGHMSKQPATEPVVVQLEDGEVVGVTQNGKPIPYQLSRIVDGEFVEDDDD